MIDEDLAARLYAARVALVAMQEHKRAIGDALTAKIEELTYATAEAGVLSLKLDLIAGVETPVSGDMLAVYRKGIAADLEGRRAAVLAMKRRAHQELLLVRVERTDDA